MAWLKQLRQIVRYLAGKGLRTMVVSVRKWLRRLVFMLLLSFLTITMYGGCRLLAVWIQPDDPYRVPQGQALKVLHTGDYQQGENGSIAERLRLFYWYGE